ncbi:hypothetical protein BVG80_16120 [Sphingobacteriales bacterium TSM_CSM]|nr:hypothetical protein BVG80_16120 [Sphingobacteriales bacterium TSM_CSM]
MLPMSKEQEKSKTADFCLLWVALLPWYFPPVPLAGEGGAGGAGCWCRVDDTIIVELTVAAPTGCLRGDI